MSSRRKSLLVVLLVLLLGPVGLGRVGAVELVIWVLLLAAWTYAFVVWAKPDANAPRDESAAKV